MEVPNIQVVVGALFWNFGLTHWTPAAGYTYWAHAQGLVLAEISSSEIVALAQKPYLSGAEPTCCQVPAERDMCAYKCICVAAVAAPRPLFMTSWCLRASGRCFSARDMAVTSLNHCRENVPSPSTFSQKKQHKSSQEKNDKAGSKTLG